MLCLRTTVLRNYNAQVYLTCPYYNENGVVREFTWKKI